MPLEQNFISHDVKKGLYRKKAHVVKFMSWVKNFMFFSMHKQDKWTGSYTVLFYSTLKALYLKVILSQGCFGMQTRVARDRTTKLNNTK